MTTSGLTTICDKTEKSINAQFSVEEGGGETPVVVESRGGSIGAPNERHSQYNLGVGLLLARLAENNCILADAVLDTRATERLGLSREERHLAAAEYSVELHFVEVSSLRKALCAAQRPIGRAPGAKGSGNNTKRMRLLCRWTAQECSRRGIHASSASNQLAI